MLIKHIFLPILHTVLLLDYILFYQFESGTHNIGEENHKNEQENVYEVAESCILCGVILNLYAQGG